MRKRHRSSTLASVLVAGRSYARVAWTGVALVCLVFWPGLEPLVAATPSFADAVTSQGPAMPGPQTARVAVEHALVTLRSDPEGGIEHTLLLVLDAERQVERLVRRTGDNFETFALEQIRSGATLASARGRDAVRLSCPACDPKLGGRVRIRYLSNGIFNSYDVLELDCRRGADGMLALFPVGGEQPIRRLRMTSRRFLGILIGIGGIQVES